MFRLACVLFFSSFVAWGQNSPLLVLLKGANALGFYTPDGSLLAQAQVGQHPHEMVLSPDGRYVYTTDNGTMRIEQPGTGGNTISIVDVASRKKVGEISLGDFRRPHGLALDPRTGRLAVTCELPDQLVIVDPAKREVVRTYRTKGKTSHMVTLGPGARWAYVSNSSSSNVAALNLTSGWVSLIATGERPEGSVLSKDGKHVYVTNREAAAITIIDTSKQEAVGRIPTGKGPVRIASTPDGRLLVYAAMHDKAIEFADPEARKVVARVPVGGTPVSLHLSPDGKLAFASAEESDTVYIVSVEQRKLVREFKTAAGAAPDPVLALR
ncbi:MAG: beta-propeller fold lactonase family protein [Acidobacteria bacterium]|nr:beta-propeller fold lactonase family protein [Acidobacteriota bacterium]